MLVLGIESSCDECSLALVRDGKSILALQTHSQVEIHSPYKGVVPELASRLHIQHIAYLYEALLNEAELEPDLIDGIAVTVCPGLRGSLMVGLQFAKGLALALDRPFVGIDHIEAHCYSAKLEETIDYPYIVAVLSGGHTVLGIMRNFNHIEVRGVTLDDACGEAFDKVARALGIPYPGGAVLDSYAEKGNSEAARFPQCSFKRYGYDLSYSGLKTAVIHHRKRYWNHDFEETTENIAAAFRFAAIEMLVERIQALVKETGITTVAFGGGVSRNTYLRRRLKNMDALCVVFPRLEFCVDNAAMIAGLGYEYFLRSVSHPLDCGVHSRNYDFKKTK